MKIAAVTIGQSPRSDIVSEIADILGPDIELMEAGALDGLDDGQIREMLARPGERLLVTRLRDGREVKVAEEPVARRLMETIGRLKCEDIAAVILLCTGEFPEIPSRLPLIQPGRLLRDTARSLMAGARLGVVVPAVEQIPALRDRWTASGFDVVVEALSPCTSSPAEIRETAAAVAHSGVDLVVLDCIGFDTRIRSVFRTVTGKPVLLPRTLAARVARELAGL